MSSESHICTDRFCEYCRYDKEPISQAIPLLPQPYMNDIRKAGGWYIFRDKAILENSRTFSTVELHNIKTRLAYHEAKSRSA